MVNQLHHHTTPTHQGASLMDNDNKELGGVITFRQISASEIPKNILGMKHNTYVEMQHDSWTARTPVSSSGGEGLWIGPLSTPLYSFKKLKKCEVVIRIVNEDSIGGKNIIGQGTIFPYSLLSEPGQYIDLKGVLSLDDKYCGKFSATGVFLLENSEALIDLEESKKKVLEGLEECSARSVSKVGNGDRDGVRDGGKSVSLHDSSKSTSTSASKISSIPLRVDVLCNPAQPSDSARSPFPDPVPTTALSPAPVTVPVSVSSVSSVIAPLTQTETDININISMTADRLEKLSGMFKGVQKQNLDLHLKVGGLEEGINKKFNQVRTYVRVYVCCYKCKFKS